MDAARLATELNVHYGRGGLGERILGALRAAGIDPERFAAADLAPVDQFHLRGRDATLELARLAELRRGERVLDVGGGIGGPARTVASEFGCRVSVLDLTDEFCRAGEMLTARCGLASAVDFRPGDALAMPFDAGGFDVVWTQHSSMNVPDKERMYAEISRVLRPGGRLALHEIVAGAVAPPHFPVPWASSPALSFLRDAASVRALIAAAGFGERVWRDVTAEALAFVRERVQALHAGPRSPLGLHVLLGERALPCFENVERNLVEGRIAVVAAVFERIR